MSASIPVEYDAVILLSRAIRRMARQAGFAVRIADVAARDWRSATFDGLSQTIVLIGPAVPKFTAWLRTLNEVEFSLRGHVVADVQLFMVSDVEEGRRVVLHALTLEG